MRLEEVVSGLCRSVAAAVSDGRAGLDGFPGYELVMVEAEGGRLPVVRGPGGVEDSTLGYMLLRLCGLDLEVDSSCVLDAAEVEHMHELYLRGWHVRIWRPGRPDCWAEMRREKQPLQ